MDQETFSSMESKPVVHTVTLPPPTAAESAQLALDNIRREREAVLERWLQHDRITIRTAAILLGDNANDQNRYSRRAEMLIGQARVGLLKLADELTRVRDAGGASMKRRNLSLARLWRPDFKVWLEVWGSDAERASLAATWANCVFR